MASKKISLDKLVDSYWQFSEDPETLDEMLKCEGYDPKKLEENGIGKIKRLMFQQEVQLKKAKIESLYLKAIKQLQSASVESKEAIFALLKIKSPSLQFRNLEHLDEVNLKQILSETELLDLMKSIEDDETEI